jgi:acetyltransferase
MTRYAASCIWCSIARRSRHWHEFPGALTPNTDQARQIVTTALANGRQWLDPVEIARLFEAYQIPTVPTFAAADAEQAVARASALFAQGATAVLKKLSPDIVRKSDVGGVVLNLTGTDAVRNATVDIFAPAKLLRPQARISGVIVQAMVVRSKARELILGLADDPTFGTVVVFGRGGTAVEIINDKALALPPLDLQLARDFIERTRVSRLLRSYRDAPAVKQDAVAMVLVKLAQMAADIPEIGSVGRCLQARQCVLCVCGPSARAPGHASRGCRTASTWPSGRDLSGDREPAVQAAARALGISEWAPA